MLVLELDKADFHLEQYGFLYLLYLLLKTQTLTKLKQ